MMFFLFRYYFIQAIFKSVVAFRMPTAVKFTVFYQILISICILHFPFFIWGRFEKKFNNGLNNFTALGI